MENSITPVMPVTVQEKKKSRAWIWIMIVVFVLIFYFVFGFVAIQPIGAIPDGITLMVIRAGTNIKFFDSADSMCMRFTDGVSLLCRMGAISAITDLTIVARLPFSKMVYLSSTGGSTFDR